MMRAGAWAGVTALVAAIGAMTASCGSDELTGNHGGAGGGTSNGTGGTGTGTTGGSSAKGGSSGSTSKGGSGGGASTGGGSSSRTSNLGKACVSDASCGTTSGLSCLMDPAVPLGLCTSDCTTDEQCAAVSPGALCGGEICIEGCQVGPDALNKCHDREDFSCRYWAEEDTGRACSTDENCQAGELCGDGTCIRVITSCQPTCGSDDECNGGYCDLSTGLCSDSQIDGKAIGEKCDPDLDPDQHECQGFCISDADEKLAFCTGVCRFSELGAPGCGWNGQGKADAGCLFGPAFIQEAGLGDAGYCGQLCDCNSDCRSPSASCLSFAAFESGEVFVTAYGRKGYCGLPGDGDVVLAQCGTTDGEGGAGGGGG